MAERGPRKIVRPVRRELSLCLALTITLFPAPAPAPAAAPGARAEFVGGTLAGTHKSKVRVDLTSPESLVLHLEKSELRIPYRKINTVEYGQQVSRRYAEAILISPLLLLSRSRKHFLTLGYVDEEEAQQAVVLRVEKGDIRAVLAGLEARTGRRVEYQDNEARKGNRE